MKVSNTTSAFSISVSKEEYKEFAEQLPLGTDNRLRCQIKVEDTTHLLLTFGTGNAFFDHNKVKGDKRVSFVPKMIKPPRDMGQFSSTDVTYAKVGDNVVRVTIPDDRRPPFGSTYSATKRKTAKVSKVVSASNGPETAVAPSIDTARPATASSFVPAVSQARTLPTRDELLRLKADFNFARSLYEIAYTESGDIDFFFQKIG